MKRIGHLGEMKKGSFLIVDGVPCKVSSVQTSAPGKHGHAKIRIDAFSLFNRTRKTMVGPSHSKCEIPIINKKQGQVLTAGNEKVQLMDLATFETIELDLPESLADKATAGATMDYWEVMGKRFFKE